MYRERRSGIKRALNCELNNKDSTEKYGRMKETFQTRKV